MYKGRSLEQYPLEWLEEPLDAHDLAGHAALAAQLDTSIGSGEMLTSTAEVMVYVEGGAVDVIMHDAPRIGGITPFLKVASLAQSRGMIMAPHFVMTIHRHLAAAYEQQTWVVHFEWLEPLFNERLDICEGQRLVPDRPGLRFTLHEQIEGWALAQSEIGKRP